MGDILALPAAARHAGAQKPRKIEERVLAWAKVVIMDYNGL